MEETSEELVEQFATICHKLGWCIAIPNGDDNEELKGLIVGTDEYVDTILGYIPDNE